MATTRVILLRHGETDVNRAGCYLGDLDVPLNPSTIPVVQKMADAIVGFGSIDHIISSPLRRARETASIIADKCKLEVVTEPEVREMSFGQWDGKTSKEVAKEDLLRWKERQPAATTGPTGGETLGQVGQRVERDFNRLCETYPGKTIVVVTHVYVIKAALDRAMELPDGYHANRLWLDTATATIIDWHPKPHCRTVHRVNWSADLSHGATKWVKPVIKS